MTKKKYSGYDSFLKLANAIQIGTLKKQAEIKNEKISYYFQNFMRQLKFLKKYH